MNIQDFATYSHYCHVIHTAFGYLPDVNADAVFTAWERGGIFLPDKNVEYGIDWQKAPARWWINVGAHMSVVAVLGFKLAEMLTDDLARDEVTPLQVVEALLVHDWNKRAEVNFIKTTKGVVEDTYRFALRENNKLLRTLFSEVIVSLAAAAGHGGIHIGEERKLTLGEKIVFYADMCTSGYTVTTYEKRLSLLARKMKPEGIYAGAEKYFQKQYGMSYKKKHQEHLLPIEKEIVQRAGLKIPSASLSLWATPKIFHLV